MMMAAKLPASFQEQVVIQSGYKDDTKGLWSEIWNTLMGYINADDSPNKLQQKNVLVGESEIVVCVLSKHFLIVCVS